MTINYQFKTNITPPKTSKMLYAITPHHSVEVISKQHVMLSHTTEQKVVILEHYLTNVIDILKTFRTLDDHVKEVKRFMDLGNEADSDIRGVIKHLKDSGFLINGKDSLETAQAGLGHRPLEKPPVVVIRTKGRVAMLKRLIKSAEANEQQFNARYEYLFIDDSTPEQAEANAININQSALNAKHIDRATQQAILEKLQQQFPEATDSLGFLLGEHPLHELSPTYGRTWNWGVLLSAGRAVVYLDDDCLLEAYAPPIETTENLSFGRKTQSVHFLDKDKQLSEQLQRIALDPIDHLAVVLGLTPKQLACDVQSFAYAENDVTEQLASSHVMMSTQAIAGDTGSDSPFWLYHVEGKSAKAFVGQSESDYQKHKTERFMWLGGTQPLLGFGGNYSVVSRAMDNRQVLPPTLPIFRNEDALFANLVHYLYPNASTCDLTWALAHLPEIERQWTEEQIVKTSGVDLTVAVDELLEATVKQNLEPKQKLRLLSEQFQQILASEKTATEWLYRQQQAGRAAKVCQLNNILADNPTMPDYWKEDVQAMILANMPQEQPLITGGESVAELIEVLQLFAKSLSVWSDLWAYMQENTDTLVKEQI